MAVARVRARPPINLSGAHIPGTTMSHAYLAKAKFRHANLSRMDFEKSTLLEADFSGANLSGTNLSGTDMSRARFIEADLTEVDLRSSTVAGADFLRSKLKGADIRGLDLAESRNLTWDQVLKARFDTTTNFPPYLDVDSLIQHVDIHLRDTDLQDRHRGDLPGLLAELVALCERTNADSVYEALALVRRGRPANE